MAHFFIGQILRRPVWGSNLGLLWYMQDALLLSYPAGLVRGIINSNSGGAVDQRQRQQNIHDA